MLTEVVSLIAVCRNALEGGRFLKHVHDEKLTQEEKDLLRSGARRGQFQITLIESIVHVVCLDSGRIFGDEAEDAASDPMVAAKYLEAFESLSHRGLVRHHVEDMFQLTGTGFRIARELAGESSPEGR
jgi:hypothetical protein